MIDFFPSGFISHDLEYLTSTTPTNITGENHEPPEQI